MVDVLWTQVCDGWDDDKRHQAFIQYCREHELLGEAARRYRDISDGVTAPASSDEPPEGPYRSAKPQRDEAKKRLAAIALLAMAAIDDHRSIDVERSPRLILRVVAVVLFLASLIALSLVLAAVYGGDSN